MERVKPNWSADLVDKIQQKWSDARPSFVRLRPMLRCFSRLRREDAGRLFITKYIALTFYWS